VASFLGPCEGQEPGVAWALKATMGRAGGAPVNLLVALLECVSCHPTTQARCVRCLRGNPLAVPAGRRPGRLPWAWCF